MATYVIGDIQGCAQAFMDLLASAQFDSQQDRLWVAGDLVNRGPDNLTVLRYIKNLGSAATVVLGNHDLHLIAAAHQLRKPSPKDTLNDVLEASDGEELVAWLCQQKLCHYEGHYFLSHAGLPHCWSIEHALELAAEVEQALGSEQKQSYLAAMYGNQPDTWSDELSGNERLRTITNYFTRMRFIASDGRLDFASKEGRDTQPEGMQAWFNYPRPNSDPEALEFLFGHWAALEGETNRPGFIALDTGCVWGGALSMLRLDDKKWFRQPCPRPS